MYSEPEIAHLGLAKEAVVEIFASSSTGAGFFVHQDGFILTNKHVTGLADSFTIRLLDETILVASFEVASPDLDLAVLKVRATPVACIAIDDDVNVAEGQTVFAIGHPQSLRFTVTRGIVSAADRIIDGVHYVQTDVAINPGNSGGPLINVQGSLLGINSMILQGAHGIGFAIGIHHIKSFLQELG